MLIDWFTVIAQTVNFLILVWLLRRFLYKPILDAIDAREKRIADELADADSKKKEAQKEHDEFRAKNDDLDHKRAALIKSATDEANARRDELLADARSAADVLSKNRAEALKADAEALGRSIAVITRHEVFAITRKALADLADLSLEERMTDALIRRLGAMEAGAKKLLSDAIGTKSDPVLVRSAFPLPAAQRASLQYAINSAFAADIPLRFEVEPDLVGGIELTAGGQKLAWSITGYLTSLEAGVGEILNPAAKPVPAQTSQAVPNPALKAA